MMDIHLRRDLTNHSSRAGHRPLLGGRQIHVKNVLTHSMCRGTFAVPESQSCVRFQLRSSVDLGHQDVPGSLRGFHVTAPTCFEHVEVLACSDCWLAAAGGRVPSLPLRPNLGAIFLPQPFSSSLPTPIQGTMCFLAFILVSARRLLRHSLSGSSNKC